MTALCVAVAVLLQAVTPVQTIARDTMSQVDEPRQAIARTDAEFAALWKQHGASGVPPKVDFASHTVVAVFLGSRPSAGYAVEITGTRMDGSTVVVEWRERRPKPGQMSAQVMTSPAHFATIAKTAGEIRFQKIEP